MKRGFFFIFICIFLISCSTHVVKPVSTIEPPDIFISSPVAVLPFTGNKEYANEVTSFIESSLSKARIYDKPVYTLVERERLRDIMNELQLSYSGFINKDTAVQIGNMTGAKTVILGKIIRAEVVDTQQTEERSECLRWKKGVKWYEKALGIGCKKWREYYVPCIYRKAYFSMSYKIADVEKATLIYSDKLDGESKQSKSCLEKEHVRKGESFPERIINIILSGSNTLQDKNEAIREAMKTTLNNLYYALVQHKSVLC